jgi:arginase
MEGASPFELVATASHRPLLVVGAGLDGSGTARGECRAPRQLRAAGLAQRLGANDFGDLAIAVEDPTRDPRVGIRGFRELISASHTIADAVASSLSAGWCPLVIGGCCSVVPGAVAGARRHLGPIALAFVDGHLDLFDGETSPTGEVAGMDMAIVVGHGPPELTTLAGDPPLVDAHDVIAVGDGDHSRRVSLRAPGPGDIAPDMRVVDCDEVLRRGAAAVGLEVATQIGAGSAPFWLHIDLDVVDASQMPAVTFPVATGISWPALEELLAPLLASDRMVGLTLTDYNPDRDVDGMIAQRIVGTLARGLASMGEG